MDSKILARYLLRNWIEKRFSFSNKLLEWNSCHRQIFYLFSKMFFYVKMDTLSYKKIKKEQTVESIDSHFRKMTNGKICWRFVKNTKKSFHLTHMILFNVERCSLWHWILILRIQTTSLLNKINMIVKNKSHIDI